VEMRDENNAAENQNVDDNANNRIQQVTIILYCVKLCLFYYNYIYIYFIIFISPNQDGTRLG